jgi:germination protein M
MKRAHVLAIFVALALAALAGVAWWTTRVPAPAPAPASGSDSTQAGVRAIELYFAAASADSLVREEREVVEPATFRERVVQLVAELDRGPRGRGVAALPAGTSVLRVYVDDAGLLTLDLTGAFRQRFTGGSSAEYLAIASLVRTLGANLPEVKRVLICVAGRPISTLGGHLPLDEPLDVAEWP